MKVYLSALDHGAQKTALTPHLNSGGVDSLKVFVSHIEEGAQAKAMAPVLSESGSQLLWNLMSYYYLRGDIAFAELVRDRSRGILIDSGAFSMQRGKKVPMEEFTHQYAAFIKSFDRPNVLGYFEMDVDNIIGYENVLKLRKILLNECGCPEKIIPVWHMGRGVDDYVRMCEEHSGRIVAITGASGEDVKPEQFPLFLKEAHRHNCRLHCLGMTSKKVLDKVPFDYVDSASWVHGAIHGRVAGRKVTRAYSKTNRNEVFVESYKQAMKMQMHYWNKWRRVSLDEF